MSTRLPALDALRGLAALSVVMFHYTMLTEHDTFFNYGVSAVDIFFLISGFVVLMSFGGKYSFKALVINRIGRLYPAYWAAVLFTGSLLFYYHVHSRAEAYDFSMQWIANLSMFQYYFNQPNIDGPYWTMTYEILFFILMLLIFLFKGIQKIEWIALGMILFTAAQNFIFKAYAPAIFTGLQKWFPILSHLSLFMAGIIFYKIRTEGTTWLRIALIGLAWIIQLASFENGGMSHVYISFNEYFVLLTIYFILMFLLIYDKLNFIAIKPLLFLGAVSYPLFLIHQFISRSILIPVLMQYNGFSFWAAAGVAFIVSMLLAILIHKLIEKPAGALIKKKAAQEGKGQGI